MQRWNKLSLRQQLLIVFLVLQIVTVAFIFIYNQQYQKDFYISELEQNLLKEADLLIDSGQILFANELKINFEEYIESLNINDSRRITVIAEDGTVLYDTDFAAEDMEPHDTRPEVLDLVEGDKDYGQSIRFSNTLLESFLYIAKPVEFAGEKYGYLRVAQSLVSIEDTLAENRKNYLIFFGLILFISIAIILWISKSLTKSLSDFNLKTKEISQGKFKENIQVEQGNKEIRELNKSFAKMSEELEVKLDELDQEIKKREAILKGMMDGIIAVDRNNEIIMFNPLAKEMLGIDQHDLIGKKINQVTRQYQLIEMLETEDSNGSSKETFELTLQPGGRILRAHLTDLLDQNDDKTGTIITLTDLTELRRLEKVRQEFVANVSHELRTPLTSIIGYLETLVDDSDDISNEMRDRFLGIIKTEADRLYLLVNDLLQLSKIEGESLDLKNEDLITILDNTFQRLQDKALDSRIKLVPDYPEELPDVKMNPEQIEQVVYNLVDNAIKYTPEHGRVIIRSYLADDRHAVIVEVEDTGIGISEKYQRRIFERFYRVDKARSREKGGTGIGLSIVKHIVQNHGSNIEVESQPGEGSLFRFSLEIA
ncbi:MAG: ATP-binding protein [Bacillota bacterium]